MAMEEHHDRMHGEDKDNSGLHDKKEEKYMNPDRDPNRHKDPAFDPQRRAGVSHAIGVFLVILGAWWLLRDLNLLPHISFGAVAALLGGFWLLKRDKR